jgi:hypothetical protein
MRATAAPFVLVLAFAGCVTQQLDSTAQAITLPEQTDSVFWSPRLNDGNDIWPSDQAITTTQVMIRKGPMSSAGATFIAFVIWNGNFVGKIFRVHVGSDGADFHQALANITNARTFGLPDHNISSTGNVTSGSGTPLPHPNVDGAVHYTASELGNVKMNAQIILDATNDFLNFTET